MEGASNIGALKNAYSRASDNLLFFAREEGSQKYVALPLYAMYLAFFSIIPLYPIFASKLELQKMTIPIVEKIGMSEDEFEEYLEPLSEQDKPDLDSMLIMARQEESEMVRKTIIQNQTEKPKVDVTPLSSNRRPRVFNSAIKPQ